MKLHRPKDGEYRIKRKFAYLPFTFHESQGGAKIWLEHYYIRQKFYREDDMWRSDRHDLDFATYQSTSPENLYIPPLVGEKIPIV